MSATDEDLGIGLPGGSRHYRAFVGNSRRYDVLAASQFNLLTAAGLRDSHTLLDIGCGSLRAGRLFIPYLCRGHYFGIEPEAWLIEEGLDREIGRDLAELKAPTFSNDTDFTLTTFGRSFDFLLAQSVLSHAGPAQIGRCFAEAARVMTPTSVFFATFQLGDKDYEGTEWVYPGLVSYTGHRMTEMAAEHGLRCRLLGWPHPSTQTWMSLVPDSVAKGAPSTRDPAVTLAQEALLTWLRQRSGGRRLIRTAKRALGRAETLGAGAEA